VEIKVKSRILAGVGLVMVFVLFVVNSEAQVCSPQELRWDVANCGTCGNDCSDGAPHALWTCNDGSCRFEGCESGWWDPDGDQVCDYACAFTSPTESCNGLDDDCDGLIDEDPSPPSPSAVCGVDPAATAAECTAGVTLACVGGAWDCTFPADVCAGGCSADDEICDDLDNDCDGLLNENVPTFGAACASDDGLPFPGHGPCRTTGTFVCDGPSAAVCSAAKAPCDTLPGGCTELCDGVDNDCDGLVDETYLGKGSDPAHFVRPSVVKIAADRWMFAYEASRPDATSTSAGTGNGLHCLFGCPPGIPSAPFGVPLQETLACSSPGRVPWYGATPVEAEQTCAALGGSVCTVAEWETACEVGANACVWGYAPVGSACQAPAVVGTKECNLGPFGELDVLLPTASSSLSFCWADWLGILSNPVGEIRDVTGNLREITEVEPGVYSMMGGSFLIRSEQGAACTFDSVVVDESASPFDGGFRCCFDTDPTL
jgi:hypothetical protein